MKINNKKIAILITVLILGCSRLFALADGIINFDIRPEFGILHGSVSEYVFDEKCKNTDNMESRLDWDLTAIPYIAGAADITILRYIFIGLNGRYGFPVSTGNMQDYDWLNSVPPSVKYYSWLEDDPTELTNYSKHDNFLDEYYCFSIEAGGTIPIYNFSITPVLAYEYSYIQFTGSNGYRKYKSDNFEEKFFENKVISYAQEANIFKMGIKLSYLPFSFLHIDSNIYFSPLATSITALDKHFEKSLAYLDKIEKGLLFQANLGVEYYFTRFANIGIKCGFEYLPIISGNDFTRELNTDGNFFKNSIWKKEKVLGGTSHYIWNWSLVYSLSF